MGCWNGTCLISNLPIYAGDEVVFFVLKRKCGAELDDVEHGHCYADALYEPLLYPIVGDYDDYGCIENVREDFSLIEKYFENIEVDKKEWEKDDDVFRNIERGNYKEHTFALIHKDVYNILVGHLSNRKEWWSKNKSVKDFVMKNIEEKTKEYFDNKQIWEKIEGVTDIPTPLIGTDDIVCGRGSRDYFVAKYLETLDEALLNKLVETHLVHCVLGLCRKFWFPQTGAGSQDSEVDLYEILTNKMIEKCKQTRERWES
jgi:hypothetical protein